MLIRPVPHNWPDLLWISILVLAVLLLLLRATTIGA